MKSVMWKSASRETIVCIDKYENSIPEGRIYNARLGMSIQFRSTMEFIKKLEMILEKMKFPQSFSANRKFQPIEETNAEDAPVAVQKKGASATFMLNVLFRQNASWQGSVIWLEGQQEESFRSVLELLLLMDSALCESTAG